MEFHESSERVLAADFGFSDIVNGIDWSEPWLIGLIACHIALTGTIVVTRQKPAAQAVLFVILLMLVYSSEKINEFAAENWRRFSKQQYFDSQGMFISFIFSMPLLANCVIVICNWLWLSGVLMVRVKQAELRNRVRSAYESTAGHVSREDPDSSVDPQATFNPPNITKGEVSETTLHEASDRLISALIKLESEQINNEQMSGSVAPVPPPLTPRIMSSRLVNEQS